jgi:quercetin dioxygenase-like cupin family protein
MIGLTATLTMLALLTPASTEAQTMVVTRSESRAARPGPPENFTGSARIEMLFEALDPSHASGGSVTFEAGARTAWHTHPRGQILIVTAGTGRVQQWGHPIEEIRAGDVVRIPAGQKHWHGASPASSMTHIAITEHRDGTAVQWMEKVSDDNTTLRLRALKGQGRQRKPGFRQSSRRGLSINHRPAASRPDRCSSGSRPAWRRSLTTCCSVMSGGGLSCHRAIAAWSLSPS